MKLHYLFFAIALVFIGCSLDTNKTKSTENTNFTDAEGRKSNNSDSYWQPMVMHEMKDNKGVIQALIPLPASWKLNVNGKPIIGPDNITATDFALHSFMMNYDQSLQYAYSQTHMRAMPKISRLIQEDIVPFAAKQGFTYIKYYELPEVSKMDKWYSDQLYKAMPARSSVKTYGIDLKDTNGNPAFLILRVNSSETQSMQNWYYVTSLFEADKSVFEVAKKQYLFGLTNIRYNLEPIISYNEAEAQRIGQSWANFRQRMTANQAAFEAQQRNHINKTEAINNAIMNGWESRNKAMDKNQDQFLDYVKERENVQNSETGKTYKVEHGYNRYWMNSDGEYIATKQQDYDPNADKSMNQEHWQELNKVK